MKTATTMNNNCNAVHALETTMELNGVHATESFGHRIQVTLAGLLSMLLICFSVGCGNMHETSSVPTDAAASRPSGLLAAGDEINVAFSGAPELNSKQKIQANGKVSLPTIGDVTAAGKTITSFQSQLTSMYQPHLQDPTVIVSLESAAAGVYVSGEVLKPGKYPLDRPMTALEAVMEAGGFSKFANKKNVVVVRNQSGKQKRYVLNMNNALDGMDSSPFYVRSYDVIYVKQSNW